MQSIGTDACGWAEGNKVKAVLSFMKQTMTDEEFKVLRDLKEDKTKKTVKQVCADVEARCMSDMLQLEGKSKKGRQTAAVTGPRR